MIVQNVDIAAKVANYASLKPNELLVHNTFYSIQGEGPLAGSPAFFVRLAGCNYGSKTSHCQFCDTKFSLKDGLPMSFADLELELLQLVKDKSRFTEADLIVITGGEPALQKNLPAFVKFLTQRKEGPQVQIETNGVFDAVLNECIEADALVVCSPKASVVKGYGRKPKLKDDLLQLRHPFSTYYKFVVTSDSKDVHYNLPDWVFELDPSQVYLSPMTMYKKAYSGEVSSVWDADLIDQVATAKNYSFAADRCLIHGFNLTVQLHTLTSLP